MDQGIHTDREIFVIRDRYTGIIWAYPSMEKFTTNVAKERERKKKITTQRMIPDAKSRSTHCV